MPAESQAQQRLMGMAHAYQEGTLVHPSAAVRHIAERMTPQQVHDFAATKIGKLPEHVKPEHRARGGISGLHMPKIGSIGHIGTVHVPAVKAPTMHNISPSQGTPWWSRREAAGMGRGFADGGQIGMSEADPWWTRSEAHTISDIPFQGGLIGGSGAGRTDRLPLTVPSESHVIPADVVSTLGQGATDHGGRVLWGILGPPGSEPYGAEGTGPHQTPIPREIRGKGPPRPPPISRAFLSGEAHGGIVKPTSILAASGEFVATPYQVAHLGERGIHAGFGKKGESALQVGHRLLDEMIHDVRQFQIQWLKHAPTPKKSAGGMVASRKMTNGA